MKTTPAIAIRASDHGLNGEPTASVSELIRKMRKARKESQLRFWSRFGVTQTRGSRFELGQDIPPPVAILLKLYLDGVIDDGDLWRARRRRCLSCDTALPPEHSTTN